MPIMTKAQRDQARSIEETEASHQLGVTFAKQARPGLTVDQVRNNGMDRLAAAGLYARKTRELYVGYFLLGFHAEFDRLHPADEESELELVRRGRPLLNPTGRSQGTQGSAHGQ